MRACVFAAAFGGIRLLYLHAANAVNLWVPLGLAPGSAFSGSSRVYMLYWSWAIKTHFIWQIQLLSQVQRYRKPTVRAKEAHQSSSEVVSTHKNNWKYGLKGKIFARIGILTRPLIEMVGMRHICSTVFNNGASVRRLSARMSDCSVSCLYLCRHLVDKVFWSASAWIRDELIVSLSLKSHISAVISMHERRKIMIEIRSVSFNL